MDLAWVPPSLSGPGWDTPPPPVFTDTCENITSHSSTYAVGKKERNRLLTGNFWHFWKICENSNMKLIEEMCGHGSRSITMKRCRRKMKLVNSHDQLDSSLVNLYFPCSSKLWTTKNKTKQNKQTKKDEKTVRTSERKPEWKNIWSFAFSKWQIVYREPRCDVFAFRMSQCIWCLMCLHVKMKLSLCHMFLATLDKIISCFSCQWLSATSEVLPSKIF